MPPGGFHMEVDLSDLGEDDQKEVTSRRAAAFEAALRHGASDPAMRLQMIFGEAYRAYQNVLFDLTQKLAKESAQTRALAKGCLANPGLILGWVRDAKIADTQQRLLEESFPESEELKCLPAPE